MRKWIKREIVQPMKALLPILILVGMILSALIVPTSMMEPQTVQANPDWLTGYNYRQEFVVNGSSAGVQTNYQIKLFISNSTDSSTGAIAYTNGHTQADFDDIRFTTADEVTELDYWVETVNNGANVTVWVEFDSITSGVANTTTFYMYYGNSTVTSASNGTATFISFDDFESGNDGDEVGGDWTELAGVIEISTEQAYKGTRSMKLEGSAAYPQATITKTAGTGYAIRFHVYKEDACSFFCLHGDGVTRVRFNGQTDEDIEYYTSAFQDTGEDMAADAWVLFEVRNVDWGADTYDIVYQGSVIKSAAGMQTSSTTANAITLGGLNSAGVDTYIDNFFIRKWVSPEPYFGTWGSEETLSSNPLVTTNSATNVNEYNATLQGNITSTGANATCDLRGFEWYDLRNNYTTGDNSYAQVSGTSQLAQTFTTNETINVTRVRLKLAQNNNWYGIGPLDCYAQLGTCFANGTPTGTILRTGTFNGSTLTTDYNEGAWYSIDFSSSYLLANNTQYAIILSAPNATADTLIWRVNDSGNYTGGIFYIKSGGFGGEITFEEAGAGLADAMFEVWGRELWTEAQSGSWAGTIGPYNHTVNTSYTGTTHTYRALTHTAYGWGYGDWVNFSYSQGPTVDTTTPNVGETNAQLTGAITSIGGGLCDIRGFVWDTSSRERPNEDQIPNSTAYTYNWTEGSAGSFVYGVGSFSHNDANMTRSTQYFVRACAHNNISWDYGDEVSFWTLPAGPTNLTDSNRTSTSITLTWTKGTGASNTMVRYRTNTYPANATDGTQGYFGTASTAVVPNLSNGQKYYFKAWSWFASAGYSLNETNDTAITLIGTVTNSATGVTNTSATMRGTLTSSWDNINARGFEWGTTSGTYTSNWTQAGNYTTGSYSYTNTTLTNTTTYYYRAMANGTAGWSYGAEVSFTTTAAAAPTITTNDATNVGETSAILHGTLTGLGDYSPVYVSFDYGPTTSYGYNTTEQSKTGTGVFNVTVSGLVSHQTYYFRAKVRYGSSYGYGGSEYFSTTGILEPPTNLYASRADTEITLTWVRGLGASRTLIRRSTTNYPTTVADGVQIYLGSGTTITDTGLSNTQEYYYSAWSEASGIYSDSYAIVYSAPSGTGEDILDEPDTFYITNVMVFESYQASHDQLICFEYQLTYSSGDPPQDASDFFAFELYNGTTMIARAPVVAWGWKPGSIYLSADNAMVWANSGYTVKLRGVSGQWSTIPGESVSITSSSWQSNRGDKEQLREWVLSIAKIINPGWIASLDGEALNDAGCAVFRPAIPGLANAVEGICASTIGYPDVDYEQTGEDYQRELTRQRNLGNYTNNIIDTMGDTFGIDGDTMGTMIMVIIAIGMAIGIGAKTRNSGFATGSTVPVLVLGNYLGLIPLAATMVAGGLTVMFILWHIWIRGT